MSEQVTKTPKKKKMAKGTKIAIGLFAFAFAVLVAGGAFLAYGMSVFGQFQGEEIPDNAESIGINSEMAHEKYDDYINIVLFGVDNREKGASSKGLADAIMVLTVDRVHNKMKVTSLLRDSLVEVEGYGQRKLNYAYAKGGPTLAIKTINQNFGLNIRDYVTVNFDGMAKIIDMEEIGGVEIDVKQAEIENLNHNMDEYCDIYKIPKSERIYVTKPGLQTLNGMQACGYARIRYVGMDDRQRTQRQRDVIEQVFNKVLKLSPTSYLTLANELAGYVETSLTATEIVGIGKDVMISGVATFDEARFPMDKDLWGESISGLGSVINYDKAITQEKIYNFIFKDIDPSASSAAK
ncbi:MAG: LCP family protein [Oscillospiraceae bacterium]|nr:LytR family transcriptional regulator [Oscillospiraceae bacterium]MBQ8731224.1 LCP family protein [Oscillospiraceae bacterium]